MSPRRTPDPLAAETTADAPAHGAAGEEPGTAVDTVAAVDDRRKAHLAGIISSLVILPRSAAPAVEAELDDGTGTIALIWLGRERIPGIEPGARIEVTGFAARRGGRRVMYNPRYEITRMSHREDS